MHCTIDGITHRGEGVARIEGKATFIPFSIPGEELDIEIISDRGRFSRAKIKEILKASADRVEAPCPYYYKCGGCSYQHVNYQRQLEIKQQVVQDALQRIGQLKVNVEPVIGMDNPWHYRNKVTWHVGEWKGQKRLGYYRFESRNHLAIEECLLLAPEIQKLSQFLDFYLSLTGIETGKQLIIRQSSLDQKLILIAEGPVDRAGLEKLIKGYPELQSVFIYENNELSCLFGPPYLSQQIGKYKYQVSPLAFFQVNNEQTKRLYDLVKNAAAGRGNKVILDAYCGTGSIAIYTAEEHKRVVGVEIYPQSIEDARRNAALNNLDNCEFYQGACEKVINNLSEDFDTIILDPPRAGCDKDLLQQIAEKDIKEIIYVSCNPATLARDIKILSGLSYQVERVQPVDMFPHTHHVETVTVIERK